MLSHPNKSHSVILTKLLDLTADYLTYLDKQPKKTRDERMYSQFSKREKCESRKISKVNLLCIPGKNLEWLNKFMSTIKRKCHHGVFIKVGYTTFAF